MAADNSSWKAIQLQGKAPWGFRLTNSSLQPGLIVSKVRERSKAFVAGLRENDVILYLNALPTHSMTLQEASDLIDSSETLRLVVTSSSLNNNQKRYDEAQNITHYNNNNNNNNDNLRFGLNNNTSDNNNNNNNNNNTQTPSSNTNLYAQNQYRIGMSEERNINSANLNIQQQTQQQSDSNTGRSSRVLSNPAFSKFSSSSLTSEGFRKSNTSFSNIRKKQEHLMNMSNSGYLNNQQQQQQRQQLQPQHRQRYDSGQSQTSTTIRVGPSPTRRNYFSATESCGEETDNDDSVFLSNDNANTKTSFASLTLRQPLKDVNYFSDTETMQTNSPLNYYKVKHQNTIPKPYRPFGTSSQQSSSLQQNNPVHSSTPQINNSATSSNTVSGAANFFNKYATQKQAQQQVFSPTHNPYSPSAPVHKTVTTTTTTTTSNNFKVPNIYDKINPKNRLPSSSYQFPVPSGLLRNTEQHQHHQVQYQQQPQQQLHQVDHHDDNNEQDDFVYNPNKKYEEEMGTELMKHVERDKPLYADSYFYNSPLYNYPTIDDQKRLAKVICATLEGSDPDTSKYHKYKKKQLNQQQIVDESYDPLKSPYTPSYNASGSPSHKAHHSTFVFDEHLPDVVRKSIAQAELSDPVRMVQAPEEFKQLHYTEHNTHTEMPPQAAMSLAAALQTAGGRGAQIFQKRKAKSEKWVVDDSNVKKTHPYMMYAPPQQEFHKFQPPPSPAPIPTVPIPKAAPLLQPRHEEPKSNFTDFNLKPRGWNTGDEHTSQSSRVPLKLSIDQSIREGIQELHFRNDDRQQSQQRQFDDSSSYHRPDLDSNPHKIDLSYWNSSNNQDSQDHRPMSVSKDGIQNLKQRFFDTFSSDNNSNSNTSRINSIRFQTKKLPQFEPARVSDSYKPVPQISKIKLNKLNSDFLIHQPSNQYIHTYAYDDQVAASDL